MSNDELLTKNERQIGQALLTLHSGVFLSGFSVTAQGLRHHKREICRKMECSDIEQALIKAKSLGLLSIVEP